MKSQPVTVFQLWSNNLTKTTSILVAKCYHVVLCPSFCPWVLFLKSTFHIALRGFSKRRKHDIS